MDRDTPEDRPKSSTGPESMTGNSHDDASVRGGPDPDAPGEAVIQTVPLGSQWPMVDPFLFCAHHDDRYPAGTAALGPVGGVANRSIGSDFSGLDGWNMYHGTVVPGFPAHPHRGFETITFVRRGLIDHADSLGAAARFGRGDVQWVTAGAGISHSEMFPLLDSDGPNHVELFQIWLNLPAASKMVEPHFTMLWSEDIPTVTFTDSEGSTVQATVIAGSLAGATPPPPPPSSWASQPEADIGIWHLQFEAGAQWELPAAASSGTVRTVYVFDGSSLQIGDHTLVAGTGALVDASGPVTVTAGDRGVEVLVLQGRPIGEPVARYGPFVMNTRAEIEQAFRDYERTQFGPWPWSAADPVHGGDKKRFARHGDGRAEERTIPA
jgi:quercetin 2,3-dioxygenase